MSDFVEVSYQLPQVTPTRNFDYYYAFIRERTRFDLALLPNTVDEVSAVDCEVEWVWC